MPLLADTYDWMSAWPTEWPNVKMTLHCSILGHQIPLWQAASDWMSAWSKGWPNVKMTWYCTLFEHQMPLLGVHLNEYQPKPKDDQMSRWLDIALFLTTRWLYWRLHLTECQPDPLDEQMSRLPDLVPFLAMICLYQGLCLTEYQPDTSNDQISEWPDVVPFLATRCSSGSTSDQISAWFKGWTNIKMTWHSTILVLQLPVLGAHLT